MRSSSSSHRINIGFSSFSKIQLKDKWHTHNKRLISQRSPAYPRLYHIPNKNIDPELSFKRNFSFSNFFRFFRLSPELEYANEIIAKLEILSHTLEMCEKSSAFELFHSFWSFINILWGLVHKECDFDEKTRCGKNRPFFIDFFKKPYNLTLRSRQGVKIRLNTINMLEKVQLKAPPRLPKSFGQIRETLFLAHVSKWTDSIPVWIRQTWRLYQIRMQIGNLNFGLPQMPFLTLVSGDAVILESSVLNGSPGVNGYACSQKPVELVSAPSF